MPNNHKIATRDSRAQPLRMFMLLMVLIVLPQSSAVTPLTNFMLSKSIVNHGDLTLYSKVFEKLSNKTCLKIIAIGGSVTAGHFNHSLIPHNLLWPELLVQALNARFPCDSPAGHLVVNLGKGSTTPSMWINMLAGEQDRRFQGVDLVILETAVNQAAEHTQASWDAEILFSMITKQSRRSMHGPANLSSDGHVVRTFTGTAVMWVVASTRRYTPLWTGVPYERISDAMYAQLPVAQHHGGAIISVIDALGPFPTKAVQAWFNDTWYQGDNIHPGGRGHRILADLLYHFLNMAYEHVRLFEWYDLPKDYMIRDPLLVTQENLDFYLDLQPVTISLNTMSDVMVRKVEPCHGWWVFQDVPEKLGYIAQVVGATCVLSLKPADLARLSVGKVHVLFMKSYENMGVFAMTITAGKAARNGSCSYKPEAPVLGSITLDSLWRERASLAEAAALDFDLPPSDNSTCLLAKLEVKDAKRAKNKVKVLGISFF